MRGFFTQSVLRHVGVIGGSGAGGGYELSLGRGRSVRAPVVVLSAGVLGTVELLARDPLAQLRLVTARGLLRRLSVFTVMQHVENEIRLEWAPSQLPGARASGAGRLRSRLPGA